MQVRTSGTMILIAMAAIVAVAMLLPAAVGFTLREAATARAFVYSSALIVSLAGLIFLARRSSLVRGGPSSNPFYVLALAYLIMPLLMALPLTEIVPGLSLFRAWFEMVSAFTTTGATTLPPQDTLIVTLWRALVGWLGGLFVLVYAMALLQPLRLGGFEVLEPVSTAIPGRNAPGRDAASATGARLMAHVVQIAPLYAGFTLALWVGLSMTGMRPLAGLIVAMSTLSTSGITVPGGLQGAGFLAELTIAAFLLLGLSRLLWPDMWGRLPAAGHTIRQHPELRLAASLMVALLAYLMVRGLVSDGLADPQAMIARVWAGLFATLSFLTTTGFTSALDPVVGGGFSTTSGLFLMGLAMVGGGVATTAGGLKLMRVFALIWQGRKELEALVYPASVSGDGASMRHLRAEGAVLSWLYLMVFLFALAVVMAVLTLLGLSIEQALGFAIASLSTTGPVADLPAGPVDWAGLGNGELALLAGAMILGRLEFLLILSVIWARV